VGFFRGFLTGRNVGADNSKIKRSKTCDILKTICLMLKPTFGSQMDGFVSFVSIAAPKSFLATMSHVGQLTAIFKPQLTTLWTAILRQLATLLSFQPTCLLMDSAIKIHPGVARCINHIISGNISTLLDRCQS